MHDVTDHLRCPPHAAHKRAPLSHSPGYSGQRLPMFGDHQGLAGLGDLVQELKAPGLELSDGNLPSTHDLHPSTNDHSEWSFGFTSLLDCPGSATDTRTRPNSTG